jgi:geranylgeranyl diphosphate synthase type II
VDVRTVLDRYRAEIETALDEAVPEVHGALSRLHEAMRYSVLEGGKRIRPALTFASCEAVGGTSRAAAAPAVALELVHAYSLVHDDLPCMDDDDLRRGRPTNHRVFGEALAVLAGDGLLTRAFGVLAEAPLPAETRIRSVEILAEAAGSKGMVGGQVLDLAAEGSADVDLPALQYIHTRKTGALFRAACRLGGLAGGSDGGQDEVLGRFGETIGLAFQIVDDILDETASTEQLGKGARKDRSRGKLTYPFLLGLDESKRRVEELGRAAEELSRSFGGAGTALALLARHVVERTA